MPATAEQDDFFGALENVAMGREEVKRARGYCDFCPVRRECLKAALSGDEQWGVWGGHTARERQRAMAKWGTVKMAMAAFDEGLWKQLVVR